MLFRGTGREWVLGDCRPPLLAVPPGSGTAIVLLMYTGVGGLEPMDIIDPSEDLPVHRQAGFDVADGAKPIRV